MTAPTVLVAGLTMPESARWHDGRLWLANWGTGEVLAVDLDGHSEVITRAPTSIPFSIDWLPDGRLLVVSGRESLLLRLEPDGSLVRHADLSTVDRVFNEIVVDGAGHVYVNGGGFGALAGQPEKPGCIALVDAAGSVRRVADGIAFPNGMAVMADNATLVIAESHGERLTGFDIAEDGSLRNRRVWAELDGNPDGICVDAEGAVWYADVPHRRCVRVRDGGEVLQTIDLDSGCFSCALGGPEGRTLFMLTAEWRGFAPIEGPERTGKVQLMEVDVPRAGWP